MEILRTFATLFASPLPAQYAIGFCEEGICFTQINQQTHQPSLELIEIIPCPTTAIENALHHLAKQHKLKKAPCVAVMNIGMYQLFLLEAPRVPETELHAALQWQVHELIDYHLEDAVFETFEIPSRQLNPQNKMLYVVVARKSIIQHYVNQLHYAGFKLSAIDIPELTLRNIALLLPEQQNSMAFLWLSGQYGILLICRQHHIYFTRTLEIGVDTLLQLMKTGQFSTSPLPEERTLQVLTPIVIELQRSFDYFESHFAQSPITHLVLAPLPYFAPHFAPLLARNLEITVRELHLNEIMHLPHSLSGAQQAQALPIIGAGLRTA